MVAAVEAALACAEPLADIDIDVGCFACEHRWSVGFDAATWLADELAVRARRLMAEVAVLARAYGWSEAEILAMPAARRRIYLELAA